MLRKINVVRNPAYGRIDHGETVPITCSFAPAATAAKTPLEISRLVSQREL